MALPSKSKTGWTIQGIGLVIRAMELFSHIDSEEVQKWRREAREWLDS